jgi:hypothetical protein
MNAPAFGPVNVACLPPGRSKRYHEGPIKQSDSARSLCARNDGTDPNVSSGRASQEIFVELRVNCLASIVEDRRAGSRPTGDSKPPYRDFEAADDAGSIAYGEGIFSADAGARSALHVASRRAERSWPLMAMRTLLRQEAASRRERSVTKADVPGKDGFVAARRS